jgi:hypothetical protein
MTEDTHIAAAEEMLAYRKKRDSINKRHDGTIYRHTEKINGLRQKELSELRASLSPEAHALLWPGGSEPVETPEDAKR